MSDRRDGQDELVRLIEGGDGEALSRALLAPELRNRLLRKIISRLYSTDPPVKWKAVAAMGAAAAAMSREQVQERIKRFLWAMSDESGAVPFGIPEALGEVLAVRPEIRGQYLPMLVSYLVHDELVQTGPILAGAIWALGRAGGLDESEAARALPGLRAAVRASDPATRGAALWTLKRLGLAAAAAGDIELCAGDPASICLLIDGAVADCTLGDLARDALLQP